MEKNSVLITVASWEERFLLGIEKTLDSNSNIDAILVFYVSEYLKWSEENLKKLRAIAIEKRINVIEKELSFETPISNWHGIRLAIQDLKNTDDLLIDFTTMPRSVIWYILFFLRYDYPSIRYIYHKAGKYNEDWLSRNPDSPRLVYKLSGITHLDRPTLLIIFTGYDSERVEHLITFFEPKKTILLVQNSDDFKNIEFFDLYNGVYKNNENCIVEGFDSFDINPTSIKIAEVVKPYEDSYNIIIASLGPKPSAIALFNFVSKNPDVGVCYVPAKEFNKNYSEGIGENIEGVLDFQEFQNYQPSQT